MLDALEATNADLGFFGASPEDAWRENGIFGDLALLEGSQFGGERGPDGEEWERERAGVDLGRVATCVSASESRSARDGARCPAGFGDEAISTLAADGENAHAFLSLPSRDDDGEGEGPAAAGEPSPLPSASLPVSPLLPWACPPPPAVRAALRERGFRRAPATFDEAIEAIEEEEEDDDGGEEVERGEREESGEGIGAVGGVGCPSSQRPFSLLQREKGRWAQARVDLAGASAATRSRDAFALASFSPARALSRLLARSARLAASAAAAARREALERKRVARRVGRRRDAASPRGDGSDSPDGPRPRRRLSDSSPFEDPLSLGSPMDARRLSPLAASPERLRRGAGASEAREEGVADAKRDGWQSWGMGDGDDDAISTPLRLPASPRSTPSPSTRLWEARPGGEGVDGTPRSAAFAAPDPSPLPFLLRSPPTALSSPNSMLSPSALGSDPLAEWGRREGDPRFDPARPSQEHVPRPSHAEALADLLPLLVDGDLVDASAPAPWAGEDLDAPLSTESADPSPGRPLDGGNASWRELMARKQLSPPSQGAEERLQALLLEGGGQLSFRAVAGRRDVRSVAKTFTLLLVLKSRGKLGLENRGTKQQLFVTLPGKPPEGSEEEDAEDRAGPQVSSRMDGENRGGSEGTKEERETEGGRPTVGEPNPNRGEPETEVEEAEVEESEAERWEGDAWTSESDEDDAIF